VVRGVEPRANIKNIEKNRAKSTFFVRSRVMELTTHTNKKDDQKMKNCTLNGKCSSSILCSGKLVPLNFNGMIFRDQRINHVKVHSRMRKRAFVKTILKNLPAGGADFV